MSMTSQNEMLSHARVRADLLALAHQKEGRPITPHQVPSFLSGLMKHGGLYSMLDPDVAEARLSALSVADKAGPPSGTSLGPLVGALQGAITNFFSHLVQAPYPIPSSLMSHITFPFTGTTYDKTNPGPQSSDIPAAFTFVGQFIDHDLTMNALDLFLPQEDAVQNGASPLIDLDSVYGPRSGGFSPATATFPDIYNGDGTFKLRIQDDKASGRLVDITRISGGAMNATAIIADKRNDENQMLLQVHLLIMRFHNYLMTHQALKLSFEAAYLETLFTWQSIVRNDYLPRLVDPKIVDEIEAAIVAGDYKKIQYAPAKSLKDGSLSISLPHEFAIAFRFGHSQLRPSYPIGQGRNIVLFDNSLTPSEPGGAVNDLRGGQFLTAEHVIDWHYFLTPGAVLSNRIDEKVTSVVFDLPESTIPDDIKYIGNLPLRNLIRSRQVGVCAGEDLAALYKKAYGFDVLTPDEVEPDKSAHHLYGTDGRFRTPLWYYILREAQLKSKSGLGPLGGHLVAEVILGAIHYNRPDRVLPQDWASKVFKTGKVTFAEFAQLVAEKA